MPNLAFYAADTDLASVLEFAMAKAECEAFASYSVPGQPLTGFSSPAEVLDVLHDAPAKSLGLMLYSPRMRGRFRTRRFELKARGSEPRSWRETIEGWGLIQLQLHDMFRDTLAPCHTNHNSEARARKWESTYPDWPPLAEWDFREVTSISRKINTHVHSLAVARHGSCPVLPKAYAALESGSVTMRAT